MAIFETTVRKVRRDERGSLTWYTGEIDEVSIEVDGQYKRVKEVQTQRAELGEALRRLRDTGERAQIEVVYKPRTGNNGRVFENFYVEHARPVGGPREASGDWQSPDAGGWDTPAPRPARQEGQSPSGSSQAGRSYGKSAQERWEIALSVGSKLAVDTLPLLDENQRDPESQWNLALFWATRIHTTPPPNASPATPAPSNYTPGERGAYDEPDARPAFSGDEAW